MKQWSTIVGLSLFMAAVAIPVAFAVDDPYLWLENITGQRALQWVHRQNDLTTAKLQALPDFEPMRTRLLSILDSNERIPYVRKYGKYYYNFWRDPAHVRGIWRRTTLSEYRKPTPTWETVLDLDQLASTEKENWVWQDEQVLQPDYDRCLIHLSRGGADSAVFREFDINAKAFVQDGFNLPEAKSDVSWRDRNTLYVSTDFGPGSLTNSGYGRIVKQWKRGTPLTAATTVFQARADDVAVGSQVDHDHGHVYEWIDRQVTTFSDEMFIRQGDQFVHIDKPADAETATYADDLLLRLRSPWTIAGQTYPAGSLLAANFKDYLNGSRVFQTLFLPTPRTSLQSFSPTNNDLILNEMDNVHGRPVLLDALHGWKASPMPAQAFASITVSGVDPNEGDDYFMTVQNFITPTTLYMGVAGQPDREKLKSLPAFFNTDGLEISQHEAISRDGTHIPYFQVGRADLKPDGANPTLLYGYGGFEISMDPDYLAAMGSAWLGRGGVYVNANIRGGGEFGPEWHTAAIKEHRQRAYDDFIAIAEDLIARRVTSPAHLGICGASNGGLLMGVMLTERPDLFGAVACGSPLLDMRRYNQLLAGASWMGEYGNPDNPADWAYISKYSPYQNAVKDRHYPPVLFTTSTRDDRVHPGHARKMAALLESQGHDVLYYENTEGGHGAAANNKESAFKNALIYSFLWSQLR